MGGTSPSWRLAIRHQISASSLLDRTIFCPSSSFSFYGRSPLGPSLAWVCWHHAHLSIGARKTTNVSLLKARSPNLSQMLRIREEVAIATKGGHPWCMHGQVGHHWMGHNLVTHLRTSASFKQDRAIFITKGERDLPGAQVVESTDICWCDHSGRGGSTEHAEICSPCAKRQAGSGSIAWSLSHRTERDLPVLNWLQPLTFVNVTTWAEGPQLDMLKSARLVPNVKMVQAELINLYYIRREKNQSGLKQWNPVTFADVTTWAHVAQLDMLKYAHLVLNVKLVQAPYVNLCHTKQREICQCSIDGNHWPFTNVTTWAEVAQLNMLKIAPLVPNVKMVQAGLINLYYIWREKISQVSSNEIQWRLLMWPLEHKWLN